MNKFSPHLKFDRLADWVEGRLSPDEQTAAKAHLAECTRCASKAAELENLVTLMQTDQSEAVAPATLAAVINLFASRARSAMPADSPSRSRLRRVVAALRFDSFQLSPAYGLRSGQEAERQYVFTTPDQEIQVQVEPNGEQWEVSGQVLGSCAGGEAELRSEKQRAQASLNERCEFALPSVRSGTYTLLLRLHDIEVELPEIRLGA